MVDLLLSFAVHHEGDRFGELVHRPAVEGEIVLAEELETDHHRGSGGAGAVLAVAAHVGDLRVSKDRRVEGRSLLGVAVEPKKGSDLLHSGSIVERERPYS